MAIWASIGGGGDGRVADPFDDPAELVDPGALGRDPLVDGLGRLAAALALEEVEAELLEIAGEAGGEQPLPLVAAPGSGWRRPAPSRGRAPRRAGCRRG